MFFVAAFRNWVLALSYIISRLHGFIYYFDVRCGRYNQQQNKDLTKSIIIIINIININIEWLQSSLSLEVSLSFSVKQESWQFAQKTSVRELTGGLSRLVPNIIHVLVLLQAVPNQLGSQEPLQLLIAQGAQQLSNEDMNRSLEELQEAVDMLNSVVKERERAMEAVTKTENLKCFVQALSSGEETKVREG